MTYNLQMIDPRLWIRGGLRSGSVSVGLEVELGLGLGLGLGFGLGLRLDKNRIF
jgi:hypothetical protein